MNTFFYIAYQKDNNGVDEIGCVSGNDRKFFHDLLDEFLDNRNNPGNEANEDITCFKLSLCDENHEAQRKAAKEEP